VATRTLSLLLICGPARSPPRAVGSGERLWPQGASAALPPAETAAEPALPVANRDVKATASPRPQNRSRDQPVFETARAWLAAPGDHPAPAVKPEKPSRLFLNDAQIAGIRKRLNLSRRSSATGAGGGGAARGDAADRGLQAAPEAARDTFDTESAAIMRLKAAARALYAQLNGTQKNDLALLVRMAGSARPSRN